MDNLSREEKRELAKAFVDRALGEAAAAGEPAVRIPAVMRVSVKAAGYTVADFNIDATYELECALIGRGCRNIKEGDGEITAYIGGIKQNE